MKMELNIFCEQCQEDVINKGEYFTKNALCCDCRQVLVDDKQLENIDEIIKNNYKVFKWIRRQQ